MVQLLIALTTIPAHLPHKKNENELATNTMPVLVKPEKYIPGTFLRKIHNFLLYKTTAAPARID